MSNSCSSSSSTSIFARLAKIALVSLSSALLLSIGIAFLLGPSRQETETEDARALYHEVWEAVYALAYEVPEPAAWDPMAHKYCQEIENLDDAVRLSNRMLETLDDPFTVLMSPVDTEDFKGLIEARFGGVGIRLGIADTEKMEVKSDRYPIVESVFAGGPAAKAGVLAGDSLHSVGGKSVAGLDFAALSEMLRGPEGSVVSINLLRGDSIIECEITREIIDAPSLTVSRHGETGYIHLLTFMQDDMVDELEQALVELADCQSLVLDLRFNPGGKVDNAIDAAGLFMDEGPVVQIRQRLPMSGYLVQEHYLAGNGLLMREADESSGFSRIVGRERRENKAGSKPLVILVNQMSASGSELLTGALKDNGRAKVVGATTAGKGVGQGTYPMSGGTTLKITNLRYFTPSGAWVGDGHKEAIGIKPDHPVELQPDTKFGRSGHDAQLDFALSLLR